MAHTGVHMVRLTPPYSEQDENVTGQLECLSKERISDILPEHFRLKEAAL